jgi:hypothetical protein
MIECSRNQNQFTQVTQQHNWEMSLERHINRIIRLTGASDQSIQFETLLDELSASNSSQNFKSLAQILFETDANQVCH